jgi:hypothetical protein
MSGPANKAEKAVARLHVTISRGAGTMDEHGQATRRASSGLESWVTKLNSAVSVAQALGSAVAGVSRELMGMGSAMAGAVVREAVFHQSTMTTLNTLLGAREGRREFAGSLRLGSILPGTTEQFVSQRRNLTGMGFTQRAERDRIFALIQDMSAMNPSDSTVGDRAALLFSNMRGMGKVDRHQMRELANLHVGIGMGDVFEQLARGRGQRGTVAQLRAFGADLVHHGRATDNEGIAAIARVSMAHTHGALGHFAAQQGNSLGGMLSNLEDAPNVLLQRLFLRQGGATNSQGMSAFANTLRTLNGMLADGSPQAQRLLNIFDRLINGVFGQLAGHDPTAIVNALLDAIDHMVPAVVALVKMFAVFAGAGSSTLVPMLQSLADKIAGLANDELFLHFLARTAELAGMLGGVILWLGTTLGVGFVALIGAAGDALNWLGNLIGYILRPFQALMDLLNGTTQNLPALGERATQGLALGMQNGSPAVARAAADISGVAVDATADALDIHSPSRVMARLGGFVGAGFADGIDASHGRVRASLGALVAAPSVTAASLASQGANAAPGRSFTMAPGAVQVTVHAGASADDLESQVRDSVYAAVAEALTEFGLESGVQ